MLVAIPVDNENGLESTVSQHFGQAPLYAMVNSDTDECAIIPNQSNHRGGTDLPPVWLSKQGVQTLLSMGMGQRAIMLFEEACIPVYFGTVETSVKEMLEAWRGGNLSLATKDDGCTHGH